MINLQIKNQRTSTRNHRGIFLFSGGHSPKSIEVAYHNLTATILLKGK